MAKLKNRHKHKGFRFSVSERLREIGPVCGMNEAFSTSIQVEWMVLVLVVPLWPPCGICGWVRNGGAVLEWILSSSRWRRFLPSRNQSIDSKLERCSVMGEIVRGRCDCVIQRSSHFCFMEWNHSCSILLGRSTLLRNGGCVESPIAEA